MLFLGMCNPNLESLLGRNINDIPDIIEMPDSEVSDVRSFRTQSQNNLMFGDKSFNQLLLVVDLDNRITGIDAIFYEVFDRRTLKELVKVYGNPTRIYKQGGSEELFREKEEDTFIKAREYKVQMIECGLDESPTLIFWEKLDFTMSLRMAEQNNKTWLTIEKK